MDVISTVVPDSWWSKGLDTAGTIMLILMKMAHGEYKEQLKVMRTITTEHAVFKEKLDNVVSDVQEIKSDGKEMRDDIKQLLRRH